MKSIYNDVDKVSNTRNTNEEITLDLSIENSEKQAWIRPDCIWYQCTDILLCIDGI